ncbi:MAG: hypothetical protein ACOCV2_09350 [Persicimonas sp.]
MTTTHTMTSNLPKKRDETHNDPGFLDRIMSDGEAMDDMLLDENRVGEAIRQLLVILCSGLGVYGLVFAGFHWQHASEEDPALFLVTPLACVLGFLLAKAVCLPSFYFYTQLSGLDASFRLITGQALRVGARVSILLLAFTPAFAALALYTTMIPEDTAWTVIVLMGSYLVGMTAPFLLGLFGAISLYKSFKRLRERLPITRKRRFAVITRLVVAWSAVFLVTAPVAVYRVGEFLEGVLY